MHPGNIQTDPESTIKFLYFFYYYLVNRYQKFLFDSFWYNALVCPCGGERYQRHQTVCRAICECAKLAGLQPKLSVPLQFLGENSDPRKRRNGENTQ